MFTWGEIGVAAEMFTQAEFAKHPTPAVTREHTCNLAISAEMSAALT
jgi:hypothetical protein